MGRSRGMVVAIVEFIPFDVLEGVGYGIPIHVVGAIVALDLSLTARVEAGVTVVKVRGSGRASSEGA